MAGDDFNHLATTFSNDYISAANSGIMPDISVGQYDALLKIYYGRCQKMVL